LPTKRELLGIPLEFGNTPLKVVKNDRVLPRGKDVNLTLYYKIPDFIVEQGYKGRFWAGFNIALNVFLAGSIDLDRRVYWCAVVEQKMINETSGYAVFNVKIPHNYPGTAVDIYANIYDGGFKPLSPLYYLGRFEIEPSYITVPFIVFENEKYAGPVYANNLALIYGPESPPIPVEKHRHGRRCP